MELGIKDKDYGLIVPLLIAITGLPVLWLTLKEIPVGIFYATLLSLSFVIFMLMFFFIKESDPKYGLRLPVTKKTSTDAVLFIVGFFIAPIIYLVLRIKTSLIMHPLLTFNAVGQGQSFAALQAANSPFWELFNVTFVASIFEELSLGFLWVAIGLLITYIVRVHLLGVESKYGKHIDLFGGILLSMAFFTIIHTFNPVYTIMLFIIAAIFRFVANYLIWYFKLLALFIGFHLGNNLVAQGWDKIVAGLFTGYGALLIIIIGLIGFVAIRKGINDFRSKELTT